MAHTPVWLIAVLFGAASALIGCGHTRPAGATGQRMPVTQADPPPFTPPPGAEQPGAVWSEAGMAVAVARRVAEALVDGDLVALRRLFAARVARTQTGAYALRDSLLAACERDLSRGTARSTGPDAYIAFERIRAVSAARDRPRSGLDRSDYDYMVMVPLRRDSDQRTAPACLPTLFVQLKPSMRVVGVE